MVLFLFIIFLALLTYANFLIGKSCLYPPVIFSGIWFIALLGLFLFGEDFYPLGTQSLLIYTGGALFFSVGSWICKFFVWKKIDSLKVSNQLALSYSKDWVDKVLLLGLILGIVCLPYYCWVLYKISMSSALVLSSKIPAAMVFAMKLRGAFTKGGVKLGIFSYLIVLLTFLSLVAFYENDGTKAKRMRAVAFILLAFLYQILSSGRLGMAILIFALVTLYFIKVGKISLKGLLIGLVVFLIMFSIPAILLAKGGGLTVSFEKNLLGIFGALKVYALGGMIAFDQSIVHPPIIESTMQSLRFFYAIGHHFVPSVKVPILVLPFTHIPKPDNIYTMYISYYYDYGWLGIAIIPFLLGFISSLCYRYVLLKNSQMIILYSAIASSLILSIYQELFLTSLSWWIQFYLVTFLIYKLPYYKNTKLYTIIFTRSSS